MYFHNYNCYCTDLSDVDSSRGSSGGSSAGAIVGGIIAAMVVVIIVVIIIVLCRFFVNKNKGTVQHIILFVFIHLECIHAYIHIYIHTYVCMYVYMRTCVYQILLGYTDYCTVK